MLRRPVELVGIIAMWNLGKESFCAPDSRRMLWTRVLGITYGLTETFTRPVVQQH
jgi:hypothetical protein